MTDRNKLKPVAITRFELAAILKSISADMASTGNEVAHAFDLASDDYLMNRAAWQANRVAALVEVAKAWDDDDGDD